MVKLIKENLKTAHKLLLEKTVISTVEPGSEWKILSMETTPAGKRIVLRLKKTEGGIYHLTEGGHTLANLKLMGIEVSDEDFDRLMGSSIWTGHWKGEIYAECLGLNIGFAYRELLRVIHNVYVLYHLNKKI